MNDSTNPDISPHGRRCLGRIWAGTETQHVALDRAVLGDLDGKKLCRFDEVVEMTEMIKMWSEKL